MIDFINDSAKECAITTVILNSDTAIETQLNNITKIEDLPIMLISWDIDFNLTFDVNGILENPVVPIVALLMTKSSTLEKVDFEKRAFDMGVIFTKFIQNLYKRLAPLQRNGLPAITNATYKIIPKHGMGKHSGVMCKWSMRIPIEVDC